MVSDNYLSVPLDKFKGRKTGTAMFKEPVFKHSAFQNIYIEVEVSIYSGDIVLPQTTKKLTPVRFGQMNVIRYVESDLLYDRK